MTPNPKEDAVEEDVAKEEATAEHIRMAITIGKIAHSIQEVQTIHTPAVEEETTAEVMEAEAMEAVAAGTKVAVEATISTTIEEVTIITVTQMTVTTITKTITIKATTDHKAT